MRTKSVIPSWSASTYFTIGIVASLIGILYGVIALIDIDILISLSLASQWDKWQGTKSAYMITGICFIGLVVNGRMFYKAFNDQKNLTNKTRTFPSSQ